MQAFTTLYSDYVRGSRFVLVLWFRTSQYIIFFKKDLLVLELSNDCPGTKEAILNNVRKGHMHMPVSIDNIEQTKHNTYVCIYYGASSRMRVGLDYSFNDQQTRMKLLSGNMTLDSWRWYCCIGFVKWYGLYGPWHDQW